MKKNYVAPSLEITKFETADVLNDGSGTYGRGPTEVVTIDKNSKYQLDEATNIF